MLTIRNIYKSYEADQLVLNGVDLSVAAGEIVCLLGPSGCGKTTLLRVVAGLEKPDRGEIWLDGENLAGIPVHKRNFGFMFQEYALFPHRTVAQNIAFGLRMAHKSTAEITQRVVDVLDLVNLPGYGKRTIFELSGGERQRVALARSLAPNPRLLLLDEPLGSLDRALREELMSDLRLILKRIGQTVIFVTHDQQEALAIADRVTVMNQGQIEQIDTAQQLYQQPANPFVARFLGFQNLLPASVQPNTPMIAHTTIGGLPLAQPAKPGNYTLLIRPQALQLAVQTTNEAGSEVDSEKEDDQADTLLQVESVSFRGDHTRIEVGVAENWSAKGTPPKDSPIENKNEMKLIFSVSSRFQITIGNKLPARFDPAQLLLLR